MRKAHDDQKPNRELLEKMSHLLEEKPEEAPAPEHEPREERKPLSEPRKRALISYIAILFGMAFFLVLLSMLIQQRDSRDTISQLNQNASSALAKAEQLQDQNRVLAEEKLNLENQLRTAQSDGEDLQDQIDQLEQRLHDLQTSFQTSQNQLRELESDATQQKQKVQAYELLLKAQSALDQEDTDGFLAAMAELKPLAELLDQQGAALYGELLAGVTSAGKPASGGE